MRLPAKTSEPKLLASRPVRAKPQKTPKMLSHCRRFKRRLGCPENLRRIGSPSWMSPEYHTKLFGQHQWHRSFTCKLLKQQPWEQSRPNGHRGVNDGKNGASSLNINTSPGFNLITKVYKFYSTFATLFCWGSAAKQLSCCQPSSNSGLLCRRAQPMCMATRLSKKELYQ